MKVILHCSDSPFGNAATIALWHKQRGWSTIGYHFVILNGHLSSKAFNRNFDGHIETGRPLDDDNMIEPFEIGAHTQGNNDAIGICLIGKSGIFTPMQADTLEMILLPELKHQFGNLEIYQHSDFDKNKPYCAGLPQSFIDHLNGRFS